MKKQLFAPESPVKSVEAESWSFRNVTMSYVFSIQTTACLILQGSRGIFFLFPPTINDFLQVYPLHYLAICY